jgi:ribosomal protein S8
MKYLVKDEKLELKYEFGKGAWTYHIEIPNSKEIVGKWGFLKASGFIDDYKLENRNLFTITGRNKLLSINADIRKAINKSGGDSVTVTLFLTSTKQAVTRNQILETFRDSGVLKAFEKASTIEKNEILENIMTQKDENKQTKLIIQIIDKLTQSND